MIDHKKIDEAEVPENSQEEQEINNAEIPEDLQEEKEVSNAEVPDEALESAFIRFIKRLFSFLRPSCTFEEFRDKTSEYFEERKRQMEQQKGLKYVGGKMTFKLKGSQVKMNAKLFFFKSENEKWTVQESSNTVDKSRFNDWNDDEDLKKLLLGETVEFYINPTDEN
ncbi:MAG: hypothetical protein II876_03020 [Synergistaceae bacterium]|nr:hypothetical protein [Synergistaceae bacterium]